MEEEIVEEVIEEQPPRPVGTFYLKFENEEAFLLACEEAGLIWEEPIEWETVTETVTSINDLGEEETKEVEKKNPIKWNKHVIYYSHHHALDSIGIMCTPGVTQINEETGELEIIEEPVALQGFHVNYSGVLPLSFESALIERPTTPYRTFG